MLIWADFPDDQRGLYGTRDSILTNGIYAFEQCSLSSDPDPLADGIVMEGDQSTANDVWRYALPSGATATVGVGFNLWLDQLPISDSNANVLVAWRSAANSTLALLSVDPTGRLKMVITGGTSYYSTLPVVTANGYYHIEAKYTHEAGAFCSFEVRVEGVTKIDETSVAGTDADVGIIAADRSGSATQPTAYYKNLIIWDATGGQFNDFQGSVQVHDLYVAADVTLGGWTPSSGSDGWPLIQDAVPSNTLTLTGAISIGVDRVQMNTVYYRWTSGSVDAGTPAGTSANPWLVAHGGTDAQALANLMAAVNASGVAGTTYSTSLTQNSAIKAVGSSDSTLDVESRDGVTDTYDCDDNSSNMSWLSTSSMVGGPTDSSYISADDTPPAPSEFTFGSLPVDVTSVRGLISIIRARKTDGGDAQLQVSLSTNGVDYDAGTDRTVTTAPTWYYDVSVLDADTGAPYLPAAVDTLQAKVDRTL
jgi:hypothetical protein